MNVMTHSATFAPRELPLPPGNCFKRLIAAHAIAQLNHISVADVVERMWPSDRLVARAVSAPAMTTVVGWAAELAQRIVSDAIDALGPMSAGIQVLREGLVLAYDGRGIISAPGFVASVGNSGFVAEGDPIPVRQLASTAALLQPYKLATIGVLSREMAESSNAEQLIGDALLRSTALALDAVLFDSNAATAARPAGLRNGIAKLTASNASDLHEAAVQDISALFDAVATVGGMGPYVLVASPGRAMSLRIRMTRYDANAEQLVVGTVVGTPAVGNDLIAIAPAALATAFSPEPDVETVNAGTLILDTAPGVAGTGGPERELFQSDSIAIKVRWPVSWALRNANAVAWLTPSWK